MFINKIFFFFAEGRIIALLHEIVLEKENTLFLQEGHMCTLSKYNFNPDDNGKRLVCTAKFSQNSMEYNTTSFLPINITCMYVRFIIVDLSQLIHINSKDFN